MRARDIWRRIRALARPRRGERDLHDELAFHLEREMRRLVDAGIPAAEARQRARARFGSVALTADQCRDERGLGGLTGVAADARFALRQYRRRPFVTAAMVAVLALGLGFSSTVFVLIWSLASGPLGGVRLDDAVVRIRGIDHSRGPGRAVGREFTFDEFREYAAETDVFSAVSAWTSIDVVLDVGLQTPNLQSGAATFVTPDYFPVLGLTTAHGPGLNVRDFAETAPPAGVISHALWERFYDSSPAAIGQTLSVNGVAVTIVGVAPRRFIGARPGGSVVRVWLPLSLSRVVPSGRRAGDDAVFGIVARVRPGVTAESATAVARTVASRREADASGPRARLTTDVVSLQAENYFPPSGETPGMAGRVAAVSIPLLVLLITGTSVAALLAGQSLARRREMAVRLAMGAHRGRLVRQLLTETLLLALAGGGLGLFVVWILNNVIDATLFGTALTLDWRTVAFTTGLAVATTLLVGLSPALHATRLAVSDVLKEGDVTSSRTRLQAALVVAQIAFTQPALLAMGGRLLELRDDFWRQPSTPFVEEVVDVRFNTNPRYGALDSSREDTLARVRARLAALPGVVAVVPQDAQGDHARLATRTAPAEVEVQIQPAPSGSLTALGVAVERGRDFGPADRTDDGLVVIDAESAERLWGEQDPVGQIVIADGGGRLRHNGVFTVIGVAAFRGQHTMYVPSVGTTSHFLVRTAGPAEPLVPAIRETALSEAPDLPIVSARTLAAIEGDTRASTRRDVMAAGVIGLVALALAAVGLYAVVAVAVGQRIREIGVRTALGADRRRIVRLFIGRGLRLSLVGMTLGLAASVIVVRLLSLSTVGGEPAAATLVGVSGVVAVFVIAVTLLASWLPARRAGGIEPLSALRVE